MDLSFEKSLGEKYTSPSQKIRVFTEDWVDRQVYCPHCGHLSIGRQKNNAPVSDFLCEVCAEEYELKSKKDSLGLKIVDGAYDTMIGRLQSANNPNFFFLNYCKKELAVLNFLVVPKHFFVPEIIEKRKPLSETARRAGWVGCNVLLESIPQTGKIFFVRDGKMEKKEKVLADWKKTLFLREEKEIAARGWLLDVMRCVEKIGKSKFTLDEAYAFEEELRILHPENKHITDKIRQQLQRLRDRGYLKFVGRGIYQLS